jgi:dTDP-4-dehydrorhamnose reductase
MLAIVGADGVLGARLVAQAVAEYDERIVAFARRLPALERRVLFGAPARVEWRTLDIADGAAVAEALRTLRPTSVINAAAMTNVDACEAQPEAASAANAAGPRHLAQACVTLGASLLQVSTDYVFDGEDAHPGPYAEDASPHPINHYGRTKLEGERAVERICAGRVPWLIARTAWVYDTPAEGRSNFVTWLRGELRAGRRARVAHDQSGTPTLAVDLAAALLRLHGAGCTGLIHVAGPDSVTREAWARAIVTHDGLDGGLIDVTTTEALGQRAPRPLHAGLRTRREDNLAGVTLRGIDAGLDALNHI